MSILPPAHFQRLGPGHPNSIEAPAVANRAGKYPVTFFGAQGAMNTKHCIHRDMGWDLQGYLNPS